MSAAGDRTSEREVVVSEAVSAESEGGEKRTAQGEKRRRKPLPLDCFSVENEGYQWRNSLFSKAETEMAEGSIRAARCLFRFGGVGINTATGDPLLREIRGSLTGSGLFFPASSPRTLRGGGAKEEAAAEGDAEGDAERIRQRGVIPPEGTSTRFRCAKSDRRSGHFRQIRVHILHRNHSRKPRRFHR